MPRNCTFPTLYDEALTISISKFKEWGYLNPGQHVRHTLTWRNMGIKTGQTSLIINTLTKKPYIELEYKYMDKPINYQIFLISKPSNLGKGIIWYFLCPRTNKSCRILYLVGGMFLHREAFLGCMYEKQTYSHNVRNQFRTFELHFNLDKLYEKLYSKHFKSYYAGRPTKKYLILKKSIQRGEKISQQQYEKSIMKKKID